MTINERIDAYFQNKLSETEKQQLLQEIEADATLNSEFKFQQSVTDGIKAYRKQELIAKLDNIQIATTGQTLLLKTIGIIGIATVATLGTYMWMNEVDVVDPQTNIEEVLPEPIENENNNTEVTSINTEVDDKAEGTTIDVPSEEKSEIEKPSEASINNKEVTDQASSSVPNIVVPQVQEPESAESMADEEDLTAPEAMSSSEIKLSTRNDVEVKVSKKYTFHYQIVDDALVLYGNFNESPFEVIELKTNEGINSYLYFKDNFYSLLTDSEEIRPLNQIDNKELIKELQKRR